MRDFAARLPPGRAKLALDEAVYGRMGGRDVTFNELPVGFEAFHRDVFLNYQLNRAHALGFADRDELRVAAHAIQSFDDCTEVFADLARPCRGRTYATWRSSAPETGARGSSGHGTG